MQTTTTPPPPTTTTTTTTTNTPMSNHHYPQVHHRRYNQNLPQTSVENISRAYWSNKEDRLQNLQKSPASTRQLQVLTSSTATTTTTTTTLIYSGLTTTTISSTLQPRVSSHGVQPSSRGHAEVQLSQSPGSRQTQVYDESSLITNGFVTAALDSAIELLTLKKPSTSHLTTTPGHGMKTVGNRTPENNDNLAEVEMTEYDFVDEEPIPVLRDKPRSKGHRSSEQQAVAVLPSKKDGGRSVKEELEAIQKRRVFQLQRKDDSFDKPTTDDCLEATSTPCDSRRTTTTTTTTTVLPLPRDSVIARHRRRRARHVVTSSSTSSSDAMTSSTSSSRDTSPDRSPAAAETQQSPPSTGRRAPRRRRRLRDPV